MKNFIKKNKINLKKIPKNILKKNKSSLKN